MNINIFKNNITSIFTISHYNLSLIGGVATGLIVLKFLSKKYNILFEKALKVFIIPFYLSMFVGVWYLIFDRIYIRFKYLKGEPIETLFISLLFLLLMLSELSIFKKSYNKKRMLLTLAITLTLYSIV